MPVWCLPLNTLHVVKYQRWQLLHVNADFNLQQAQVNWISGFTVGTLVCIASVP